MKAVKHRKVVKALRNNGLVEVKGRGKGSHAYWEHPQDPDRNCTVPDHADLSIGTVGTILTSAGKDRRKYRQILRDGGP